ncbi:TonB-linked SusC/RagA family outer membrane protein [Mucilaginibacter yixingensis]|uniref:TonB-linked SusC/RagA family outer membrane protein n=1 Tax=Mucilaginibacter yixingensis TaxID=1295612 RepID=A0A2T5JDV8_9SPHI|nr:TonB-dependent receptor [Mucilaginibacter yixingensis]PTQ99956.1 TonB-linked SusC/RagA family outer membrane protein [Mucilaginibacter yixingensis]
MKITFSQILIAMIVTSMTYASSLRAQDILNKKVTLSVQNTSLAEALSALQKNNNVKFIYSKNAINVLKKVTVNAADASLKAVLEQLLTPNGIDYEVLKNRIVLGKAPHPAEENGSNEINTAGDAVNADAQAVAGTPVTGRVVDDKGMPIAGATVVEKGTTTGVTTGPDGHFKLNVSGPNAVLVFNFIGYKKQEMAVGSQIVFNVTLAEELTGLNEVVVVGYGTQKKSVTTGSISGVTARDFQDQPVTRLEQVLQGRTSGVTITTNDGQPGDGASVRVRGITTFNNNDPLYVVDGVVVDNGGISYLNQQDIESVEVLKDAASQAIYGTRAAAGVILVTTKKGKAGHLQINYNGYFGVEGPARRLQLLDATQYATLRNEAKVNAGLAAPYANPAAFGKGTDWQSVIFNNSAKQQDHELAFSGGNDKNTYYTSFGYLDQQGIVTTDISKYKRITFRINETFKPAKWVTFGENLGYAYNKSIGLGNTNSEFGGPLSSAINLDPLTPVIATDPAMIAKDPYTQSANIVRNSKGYPYGISPIVQQEITNPLAYTQTHLGNYGWGHNIVGNAFLELEPISGLKLRSTLGSKLAFFGSESFTPVAYLNANNNTTQNSFNRQITRGFNWNVENTASYTRSIGKHNINVLIGQGAYSDGQNYGTNITYFNLPVNTFADASMNYSLPKDQRDGSGSEQQVHHVSSLFARLNYDFDERYIVQGVIRRDGSSRFGANYKFGTFPSVSLGWVPTKESFWPENKVINFAKLRGGYGVVGNDNIGDNAFLPTIGGGRNYSFGTGDTYVSGYSPNAPANPNLHWEETSQTNIGLDLVVLNDFNVTLEWYKKKTTGILQNPPIPNYVGAISNPAANVGDMENTGQELSIGYHHNFNGVKLGLDGNLSHLHNEVTYLGNAQQFLPGAKFQNVQDVITRTEVGQAYASFYGYDNLGLFQTQADINNYRHNGQLIQPNARPGDVKWADLNNDGQITDADRKFIGNPTPSWQYGFTATAAYKNFDVLVFAQGQAGNMIFQGLHRLDIDNSNYTTAALNRWTGPGTSNDFPRLVASDAPDLNHNFTYNSKFYLESGTYLRLKNIQLGYTFNQKWMKKAALQHARLYVSAQNLVTFTRYTGYDPDISGSIDRGFYPQARMFMVGLSLGL